MHHLHKPAQITVSMAWDEKWLACYFIKYHENPKLCGMAINLQINHAGIFLGNELSNCLHKLSP